MSIRQAILHQRLFDSVYSSAKRTFQSTTQLLIQQKPKDCPNGNDLSSEEVVKTLKWNVPEYFNFSKDVVDKFAETDRDRIALWFTSKEPDQEIKLSFKELSVASQKAANGMASLEVKKAVCILPKVPDWWLLNLATIRANVVLLPVTTQLQGKDIAWRLLSSKADCIIADPENAWKVDQFDQSLFSLKAKIIVGGKRAGWQSWHQLYESAESTHKAANTHQDDIMQIHFTIGPNGKHKMVPHKHSSTHSSYEYCHYPMGIHWMDQENTLWNISDTGCAKSTWSTIFGPWSQGSTVFIHEMSQVASIEDLPDALFNTFDAMDYVGKLNFGKKCLFLV